MKIAFEAAYRNRKAPSRNAVKNIAKNFDDHGSVFDAPRSGRPKSSRSAENIELVQRTYEDEPTGSLRRVSSQLEIPYTSLQRILKVDLHYRPWPTTAVQALHDGDAQRRREFSEWFLAQHIKDPSFPDHVLWTDEACFKLNGRFNKKNTVHWCHENPHIICESELNVPGITVWCGIHSEGIIGPYIFDKTVTAESYLKMLNEFALPIVRRYPNLVWMQDGAPPHFGRAVRNRLDKTFPCWIGRGGPINWPPRSPDLTPCDFSLWGNVKDKVFRNPPETVQDMMSRAENALSDINNNVEMCKRICRSVVRRCEMCLSVNGGHFEHLL